MSDDKKIETIPNKSPVENIANQLVDIERKKLTDKLKKELEEVAEARKVLIAAVKKAQETEDELTSIGTTKLDLKSLAKSLGF